MKERDSMLSKKNKVIEPLETHRPYKRQKTSDESRPQLTSTDAYSSSHIMYPQKSANRVKKGFHPGLAARVSNESFDVTYHNLPTGGAPSEALFNETEYVVDATEQNATIESLSSGQPETSYPHVSCQRSKGRTLEKLPKKLLDRIAWLALNPTLSLVSRKIRRKLDNDIRMQADILKVVLPSWPAPMRAELFQPNPYAVIRKRLRILPFNTGHAQTLVPVVKDNELQGIKIMLRITAGYCYEALTKARQTVLEAWLDTVRVYESYSIPPERGWSDSMRISYLEKCQFLQMQKCTGWSISRQRCMRAAGDNLRLIVMGPYDVIVSTQTGEWQRMTLFPELCASRETQGDDWAAVREATGYDKWQIQSPTAHHPSLLTAAPEWDSDDDEALVADLKHIQKIRKAKDKYEMEVALDLNKVTITQSMWHDLEQIPSSRWKNLKLN